MVDANVIEQAVLRAMANVNMSRAADQQLEVSPAAKIFGDGSPLDSLGLVALLIDVEEILRDDLGLDVTLSDERAVSQRNSPFRTVASLTSYVVSLAAARG
jgi:acyl carrier protein